MRHTYGKLVAQRAVADSGISGHVRVVDRAKTASLTCFDVSIQSADVSISLECMPMDHSHAKCEAFGGFLSHLCTDFCFYLAARSLNGCWTCRVRKKKCDEHRPVCSKCLSLQLPCDGYGPRPEWMDDIVLQKVKASRLKRLVRRTHSKRPKQQISPAEHSQIGSDKGQESLQENITSSSVAPSTSDDVPPLFEHGFDASAVGEFQYQVNDVRNFGQDAWSTPFHDDFFILESLGSQQNWGLESFLGSIPRQTEQDALPFTSIEALSAQTSDLSLGLNTGAPCGEEEELSSLRGIDYEMNGSDTSFSLYPSQLDRLPENQVTDSHVTFDTSSRISRPKEPGLDGVSDDFLFMHYLDEVFGIQYPFYNSPRRRSRGWLFSAIRRAKSTYHATLALSEWHLKSTMELSTTTGPTTRHYDLAVREMELSLAISHTWSSAERLARSTEALTCILQLLFREVYKGFIPATNAC